MRRSVLLASGLIAKNSPRASSVALLQLHSQLSNAKCPHSVVKNFSSAGISQHESLGWMHDCLSKHKLTWQELQTYQSKLLETNPRSVEELDAFTRACVQLLPKLSEEDISALINRSIQSCHTLQLSPSVPVTLRHLQCLGGFKDFNVAADQLLNRIVDDIDMLNASGLLWSVEEIICALESIQSFAKHSMSMGRLIAHLSRQLERHDNYVASADDVLRILMAWTLKFEGLQVKDGQRFAIPEHTDAMLVRLSAIINNCPQGFSVPDLLKVISQLKDFDSRREIHIQLIDALQRRLAISYNSGRPLDGLKARSSDVAASIQALRMMTNDTDAVNSLLLTLSSLLLDLKGPIDAYPLMLAINGLQCMTSDSEPVRVMLSVLSYHLRKRKGIAKHGRLALAGLQSMNSNCKEVKQVVDALTPLIVDSIPAAVCSECLFYIRNIDEKDAPILYGVLLEHLRDYVFDPDSCLHSSWLTTVESHSNGVLRFLRLGQDGIERSLGASSRSVFLDLLKKLEVTVPMITVSSIGFVSYTEKQLFNALKIALYQKKDVQLRANVTFLSFEADMILTIIDESTGIIKLVLNIEVDGSDKHYQYLKARNSSLRDDYLRTRHGVVVLRFSKTHVQHALVGSRTMASLIVEQATEKGVGQEKIALLQQYLF